MEYRGVRYEVVEVTPAMWRWSVKRNGQKVGTAPDRRTAMQRAEEAIDAMVDSRSKD